MNTGDKCHCANESKCAEHDVNIFAARHDYIPDDDELVYALEMIVEE